MSHQPPRAATAAGGPCPLPEVLNQWVADMEFRLALTPQHFRKQRRDVERAAAHAGWATIADLAQGGAESFLVELRRAGRAGRTHDRIVSSLRRFGDFLRRRKILKDNPFGDLERLGRRSAKDCGRGTRPLTGSELERMVLVAMRQELADGRAQLARTSRRSRVYVVARWTGYRREECKRLRWIMVHDLWGQRPAVEVIGKNGQIEYLALHTDAVEVLKDQWEESSHDPKGRVFPVLPKPHTVDMDMWRAGIIVLDEKTGRFRKEDDRGFVVGFHSLRKTLNREMRRGGVDAGLRRRIMRHQQDGLTDFEYDMPDYAELKNAVDKCPSVLRQVREMLGNLGGPEDVENSGEDPPWRPFARFPLESVVRGRYSGSSHTSHAPDPQQHDDEGRRERELPGWCDNLPDVRLLAGPRSRETQPPASSHARGRGAVRQMRSGVRVPLPPLRSGPVSRSGASRLSPVESGVPAKAGTPDLTGNLARLLSVILRVLESSEHDAPESPPVQQQPDPS